MKKINSALISVFHKEGLDQIINILKDKGISIYSTGGTQSYIESMGADVIAVEDLTSYPSILGGRVKTLHPKVFGGILARRDQDEDIQQLSNYEIPEIDLVIVDLYPFEKVLAEGGDENSLIEKIDIGGISLIRAAAKNFHDTLVISSQSQYKTLSDLLNEKQGFTDLDDRKKFAAEAFKVSSHYDTIIFKYFNSANDRVFKESINESSVLRYGENPHQSALFHGDLASYFDQLHGKQLSYNNLVDVEAAVQLINEFNETTFAILKHTNPCGVASRDSLKESYLAALACDNISAFGGILICNETIDLATAEEIHKLFCEVVIAPDFEAEALEVLKQKKNRILLKQKIFRVRPNQFKSILNGVLEQDMDLSIEDPSDWKVATSKTPDDTLNSDLLFALKCAKHLKSNTISIVKNKQLIGAGCGQTSRVDALKQGIDKAQRFGFDTKGSVMASDAFFPFPDCVEIAHDAGIVSVIQPGGSIKDQDSIDCCNQNGLSMVFTGVRHFRH
ncbi:MAG: bifunctional phosphoribosylaminoimidazolecarboxamide formyltransferase/IMP cyclohydrolase [Chitinophagales bacterium]|nr:bifunctional phosphoribosylaminoimidazolecarboxamide formyltransferase/IMP cyclohydrolase [Chitinophagales bacterium]